MKRVPFLPLMIPCFVLAACAAEPDVIGDDTGLTGVGDDGTSEGEAGDDEGEAFEPVPARGITITRVTANHGINVSIAQGDQWVGPSGGREGRLVGSRDTLIRIYHEIDDSWVERDIEARLELVLPGGEVVEDSMRKTITLDTVDSYLDGGFWFALPVESGATAPGTKFQVSLWEVEPGGEEFSEQVNVSPADGPELIGFEEIPMEMNVNFVPFVFNGSPPAVDDESKMDVIYNEIFQTEPITTLNTAIDSVQSSGASSNVCNMLQTMQQIWSADGAPSNIYYVGLVNTGAASGIMGCAWTNANVNADVWVDSSIRTTATSIVHEIGHNQGLAHVECNDMGNPSQGNDPSYPDHPLGRTLNTGFGIRDFSMYPGDTTIDYMSYCNKRWVSPWTWAKVWPRIQQFTAQGSPLVVDPEPVIQFGMYPDGTESWWTALARLDPEREPDSAIIEFRSEGEIVSREYAQVDVLSDDQSVWVTARMPNGDPEAAFDSVRYVADGEIHEAQRGEVSFYTDLARYPDPPVP